ncbi:MAG: LytTR family DNA-binding domain-containing protein [Clostridiales bacterium]|nr:LytTR family DNA-binding domain-containing protein [Clostridiales bacterium]
MHLAIIDDQEPDRGRLVSLINEYCAANRETMTFSSYESGESFLGDFSPGRFSVVFLDILMDGMSGIEVAKEIRKKDAHIAIIFTTTEPGFALDSYGVHALDYLVKPVTAERLAWCLKKLYDIAAIPLYIKVKGATAANVAGTTKLLALEDILYAQSARNVLDIHMTDGDIRTYYTFREFMQLLPGNGQFYECGRGLMVNFQHVKKIQEGGKIILSNNTEVFSSRRKTKETIEAYANYKFSIIRKGV